LTALLAHYEQRAVPTVAPAASHSRPSVACSFPVPQATNLRSLE
jgi:hypothetical protein